MIPLATKIQPEPVLDIFPEDLENDNEQSDESDDNLSEQSEKDGED